MYAVNCKHTDRRMWPSENVNSRRIEHAVMDCPQWSWVDRNQKSIIVLLNYREFSFSKIVTFIVTVFFFIAPAAVCLAWLKIETRNRPLNAVCGLLTLRYTRVNAVSANQRRAKSGEIPDHLIIYYDTWNFVLIFYTYASNIVTNHTDLYIMLVYMLVACYECIVERLNMNRQGVITISVLFWQISRWSETLQIWQPTPHCGSRTRQTWWELTRTNLQWEISDR